MLKRVALDIMKQFAPAFMVICILLCLSFNYTFPLHRHPSDELLNGSQQCASPSRAKKMSPTNKHNLGFEEPLDTAGHYYMNPEATNRKLSGDDLRQYEQLVIMKKYPYLDLKEFEPKYHPSVKNAKYAREADLAEGGNCQLTDDEPHVEIFSRGISGFAIPRLLKSPPAVVDIKLNLQDSRRADSKSDDMKLRDNSRILNGLKDIAENEISAED